MARLAVLNLWLVCIFCQFLPAICMVLAYHPGKKMLLSIFKIRIESHHRLLADAGSQSGSNNHYRIFTINSKYAEFLLRKGVAGGINRTNLGVCCKRSGTFN
jgi:hypothetical protein